MGNHQSQQQKFNESNWREVSGPYSEMVQYENTNDRNIHLERHHIQTVSEDEYDHIKEIAFIRKNHPRWVSALYFEDKESEEKEFCASKYEAFLYLEKIPIRLCDLKNIPFPDALHLYDQTLGGFYELARNFGCFPVESDYIGINERGVVKVWAGAKWSQATVKGGVITQEDMVRGLVECLQESIDKNSMPIQNPSIRNFLYRTSDRINFEQSIAELKNFAKVTNMGSIPSRLNSIEDSPGRYDTDRQRIEQGYYPNNANQYQINYITPSSNNPNFFSPRFSVQGQNIQENITTFRRVQSVANEPIKKQAPASQFANRQTRAVSNYPAQFNPGIDRSPSNPQLTGPIYALRPNSSLRQLAPTPIASNLPLNQGVNSQRVSMGSYFSPELSQHAISTNHPNSTQNSMVQQAPFQQMRVRAGSYRNDEMRPITIMKQQEMPTSPPSQVQMSVHNQPTIINIPQQYKTIQNPNGSYPQRQTFQPPPQILKKISSQNQQGKSIIMQLYTSQDNNTFDPNAPIGETKQFGFVRRSESLHVDLRRFDSATIINESQPGSMRGIPTGQLEGKYSTPIANKNEFSNLNSIEEVNTEHYWKDADPRKNSNLQEDEPYSLSYLKYNNEYKPSQQLVFKNNHPVIDQNDGKSSQDFLRRLKEISTGQSTNFGSTANNFDYGSTFDKKKSVAFVDAYNDLQSHKQTRKQYIFGRSAESKNENYLNDYYDHKLFPFDQDHNDSKMVPVTKATEGYTAGIDPDIWADLQKYKL